MRQIEIDASSWRTASDLYSALFEALGSPDWHGTNLNALIDSMIVGGINRVEGPYRLAVTGSKQASDEARNALFDAADALSTAGAASCSRSDGTVEIIIGTPKVLDLQST